VRGCSGLGFAAKCFFFTGGKDSVYTASSEAARTIGSARRAQITGALRIERKKKNSKGLLPVAQASWREIIDRIVWGLKAAAKKVTSLRPREEPADFRRKTSPKGRDTR